MRPGKRKQADVLEKAIEAALSPGTFISYRAAWPFVDDVRAVENNIEKISKKEPERAAHLYEIFIAACHEKADEIDDSSGDFGMLVEDLFRGWIKARQAANSDANETVRSLLSWMEDDAYGFCYQLDHLAVKVLDKKGSEAFVLQVRCKFESAPTRNDKEMGFPVHGRGQWGSVLKILLAGQCNIDAYIALCEKTGIEAKDCKAIAEMYRSRRPHEDALSWIERGLDMASSCSPKSSEEYALRELKRALQLKLGCPEDALQSAWSEFESYPSTFTYKELLRYVPAKEKTVWRQKAIETSEKGDLSRKLNSGSKIKRMTGWYHACAELRIRNWRISVTTGPNLWHANWSALILILQPECTVRSACGSSIPARASITMRRLATLIVPGDAMPKPDSMLIGWL